MTQTRKWSLLAILLIAAVFAASWFLLIAPKRSDAEALRQQKVSQDEANQRLQQQIVMLKAQNKDLPKQQARLAQIRVNIPQTPQLPSLIRNLSVSATKSGVELVSLAPAQPTVVPGSAPAAQPAAEQGASTTGQPADAQPATAAPLLMIPISVTANGDYFEVEQFLNQLESLKRSFLVTGFTLDQEVDSANADALGHIKIVVSGRVFMSPAQAAQAAVQPAPAGGSASASATAN
jgi:Tfp pilus assembly protein PilO